MLSVESTNYFQGYEGGVIKRTNLRGFRTGRPDYYCVLTPAVSAHWGGRMARWSA